MCDNDIVVVYVESESFYLGLNLAPLHNSREVQLKITLDKFLSSL